MKRHALPDHAASMSALHLAAGLGDVPAMRAALAAGADANAVDAEMGAAPLHIAAQGEAAEAIDLLLAHGALPNLQTHSHGMTPLMVAVWHRNVAGVGRLLAEPGVDVDVVSRMGATAEALIGGFAVGEAPNPADAEIAACFDRWRADQPDLPIIAVLETPDLTPEERTTQVRALLADGANANEVAGISNPGNPGHSALLIAAREGWAGVVGALLEAGADMTLVGHFMRAHPAHKAAYNGHPEVMRLLAAHPDFPKIANLQGPFNGYTALHDAAWHGHSETVDVLLAAGVDIAPLAYNGQTAAQVARANGHEAIADRIEAAGST